MRYPLAPLAAKLHIELGQIGGGGGVPTELRRGLAALAETLDVSHRTAQRMLQHGLTERQADHAAIRAGLHPWWVWDEWFGAIEQDDIDDREQGDGDWYVDDPDFTDVAHKVAS